MQNRIAVAMSGGVDSSTAAWLLQQEGVDLRHFYIPKKGTAL